MSSSRYVLNEGDMKPVDRDADLSIEVFHLQGQHDQQTHAGGRAVNTGGDTRRGNPDDFGTDRKIQTRTPRGGGRSYVFDIEDADGHLIERIGLTDREGLWTEQQAQQAISGLADAWMLAPTGDGRGRDSEAPRINVMSAPAAVTMLVDKGMGQQSAQRVIQNTYGFIVSNDPHNIYFVAGDEVVSGKSWPRPEPDTSLWMPSSQSVAPERYTAVHEYAHIRAARGGDTKSQMSNAKGASLGTPWASMSEYGKTDIVEAHAETFAEIVLTGGRTDNRVAQIWNDEFGWTRDLEDMPIAAAAGGGDELPWLIGEGATGPVYVYGDGRVDMAVEQFHLQGEHDQQSHGRRGGASNVRTLDDTDGIIDGMGASLQDWLVVQSEPGQVGPTSAAKWRADRGMKLTERDQYTMDLMNGEPDALAEYRQSMEEKLSGYAPADDDTVAAVRAAAEYEADNPVFSKMIERYGDIPVIPVRDADGADARYIANAIVIGETTSHSGSAPITFDEFMIDRSMPGTLRHEYGHHVQGRLTVAQSEKWTAAINSWGSMSAGPEDLFKMFNEDAGGAGLSLYARMNGDETFAEAFALVTHRDFDPGRDYGPAQQIVDVMKEIVE